MRPQRQQPLQQQRQMPQLQQPMWHLTRLHFSNKIFWKKFLGATLVELMMMLLVVSMALTTMFYTLTQTMSFARDTEARVKAVSLAREWVEAMINIRNTNWLRFSSDRKNCWNVLSYNASCIGGTAVPKIEQKSYHLTEKNGLWNLAPKETWTDTYFSNFSTNPYNINIDANGWYEWEEVNPPTNLCANISNALHKNCRTIFSRVVSVTEATDMKISGKVFVYWYNNGPRQVSLPFTLTNWKSHYDHKNP